MILQLNTKILYYEHLNNYVVTILNQIGLTPCCEEWNK